MKQLNTMLSDLKERTKVYFKNIRPLYVLNANRGGGPKTAPPT